MDQIIKGLQSEANNQTSNPEIFIEELVVNGNNEAI
jgi:hypothetical protein